MQRLGHMVVGEEEVGADEESRAQVLAAGADRADLPLDLSEPGAPAGDILKNVGAFDERQLQRRGGSGS